MVYFLFSGDSYATKMPTNDKQISFKYQSVPSPNSIEETNKRSKVFYFFVFPICNYFWMDVNSLNTCLELVLFARWYHCCHAIFMNRPEWPHKSTYLHIFSHLIKLHAHVHHTQGLYLDHIAERQWLVTNKEPHKSRPDVSLTFI